MSSGMFHSIRNESDEDIVITTVIDERVPGCRLKNPPREPSVLKPGEADWFLSYEPGVSLVITPLVAPQVPRSGLKFIGEAA